MNVYLTTAWAPALTHHGATLEGLHTIRALRAEAVCAHDYAMHFNYVTFTWRMGMGLYGWLQFRTNMLAYVYSVVIVITCLLTRKCK